MGGIAGRSDCVYIIGFSHNTNQNSRGGFARSIPRRGCGEGFWRALLRMLEVSQLQPSRWVAELVCRRWLGGWGWRLENWAARCACDL